MKEDLKGEIEPLEGPSIVKTAVLPRLIQLPIPVKTAVLIETEI